MLQVSSYLVPLGGPERATTVGTIVHRTKDRQCTSSSAASFPRGSSATSTARPGSRSCAPATPSAVPVTAGSCGSTARSSGSSSCSTAEQRLAASGSPFLVVGQSGALTRVGLGAVELPHSKLRIDLLGAGHSTLERQARSQAMEHERKCRVGRVAKRSTSWGEIR